MAESLRSMPDQENGTISSGQQFGPAQRDHYPASQWALAPIASSREVVDHPPASKRRRIPGQPAFLRGTADAGYNAPLLNIYHSIPLAREALLFPPLKIAAYGHSNDWWSGTSDENSKSISFFETSFADEDRRKFAAEIQCLMAFLDNTTRAYGSVDALSEMRYYNNAQSDPASRLFDSWRRASLEEGPDEPLSQVFTSVATRAPEMLGAPSEEKDMIQIEGHSRGAPTQADFLDKIVWADNWQSPPEDVWIERFGHILTLRVSNDESGATELGILPNEIWYLDRYMPDMRDSLLQMRQKRYAILHDIERLNRSKLRLAEMPLIQNKAPRLDIRASLKTAKDMIPIATERCKPSQKEVIEYEKGSESDYFQQEIDKLLSQIEQSVNAHEQRKIELEKQIGLLMSDLNDPETSTRPLRHKYTLHGVSTKPNITYFRTLNRDLIGFEDDGEVMESWQWWRTAWLENPDTTTRQTNVNGNTTNTTLPGENDVPYTVTRVSLEEVRSAAQKEHHTAMLVYADETAMNFEPQPLSPPLKEFVEVDNRAFQEEISAGLHQATGRQRGRSNESNTTIMDENPFDDNVYVYRRDPTPMSTSSTIRSLSGQPSPKRPRSSDSMQNMNLMDDDPPTYDVGATEQNEEMIEKRGNKIGFYAEQLLHNVELNESKG